MGMQEIPRAQAGSLLQRLWRGLGPGLVTGAADDDPSGIATHSQIGAQFGYALSWTFVLSFPLMVVIQEVAAQIGCVTGRGLGRAWSNITSFIHANGTTQNTARNFSRQ